MGAMTEDDKALVERLREEADEWDEPKSHDDFVMRGMLHSAADLIEAIILSNQELHSENERLRGALNDALSHCYNCSGDPHYIEEDEVTGDHLWTDCPICRSARTALGETK